MYVLLKFSGKQLLIVLFVCFCFTQDIFAQEIWTGVTFKNELKKWTIQSEVQHRNEIKPYKLNDLYIEPAIGYKVLPFIELKSLYRYRFLPDVKYRHRVSLGIEWDPEMKDYKLRPSLRILAQRGFNDVRNTEKLIRTKFELGYKINDTRPYFGAESFNFLIKPFDLKKLRTTFGMKTKISERIDLSVFYRREDFFTPDEEYKKTEYIIGATAIVEL